MAYSARVLVTEDDDAVRGVILRVLSHQGYDVIEACHMPDALSRWEAAKAGTPIDLLITDYLMPGGTGHELAAALWTTCPELPVLFMSGYEDDAHTIPSSTRVVHLAKPFTSAQLLGQVQYLLQNAVRRSGGSAG